MVPQNNKFNIDPKATTPDKIVFLLPCIDDDYILLIAIANLTSDEKTPNKKEKIAIKK